MANEFGLFFNSVNGDRTYNADSFSEWLQKFFTTGVFNGDLQVTESDGMTVTVGTGYANINGKVRLFDTTQQKTLAVASGTYPRIDTIVIRLDTGNREITCELVQGEYSGASPSPTAPVRSGGIYELVLAQIYVGEGATEITTENITDTRADEDLCGWVTSTVESVPVEQIVAQMQAQFSTWFEYIKGQLDEDIAGHLQNEINAMAEQFAVAEVSPATLAHSTGTYLTYNNVFYVVIDDIAVGDTLTVGSNIRATNVGEVMTDTLDAINSGLSITISSNGWGSTVVTINGIAYYVYTANLTAVYNEHPEIGIVPISGTLPTEAEQEAYDSVKYFTVDNTNLVLKAYAEELPTDSFGIYVKGVA